MAKTIYRVGDDDWSGDVMPAPDARPLEDSFGASAGALAPAEAQPLVLAALWEEEADPSPTASPVEPPVLLWDGLEQAEAPAAAADVTPDPPAEAPAIEPDLSAEAPVIEPAALDLEDYPDPLALDEDPVYRLVRVDDEPAPEQQPKIIRGEPVRPLAVIHEDALERHAPPARRRKLVYVLVGLAVAIVIMAALIFALNAMEKSAAKASSAPEPGVVAAAAVVVARPAGIQEAHPGIYWWPNRQPGLPLSGESAV